MLSRGSLTWVVINVEEKPDPQVTLAVNRIHVGFCCCFSVLFLCVRVLFCLFLLFLFVWCCFVFVFSRHREQAYAFHLSDIYFRLRKATKHGRTKMKSPHAARHSPCWAKWRLWAATCYQCSMGHQRRDRGPQLACHKPHDRVKA